MIAEANMIDGQYKLLFEASPLPTWLCHPATLKIIETNSAATKKYGYSRTEFLAQALSDLHAEEDQAELLTFLNECCTSNAVHSTRVWLHRHRSGKVIDVQITSCDIQLDASTVRMVLAQDVSQRLRTDAAESAKDRTLRKVLFDIADGLVVLGADSNPLFVNAAARQILGLPEQYVLESDSNIGRDAVSSGTESLIGSGYERVALDVFGATHHLDLRTSLTTGGGKTERLLILQDGSQQRESAQKLLLLRRAVEATDNGVVIVNAIDPEQPMIYVNRGFELMTGYRANEVIGLNCRFLQREDTHQVGLTGIRKAIAAGASHVAELRNYRKDGSLFWSHLRISPVRDDAGAVSHFIGIQTDISEQKRLEEESIFLLTHDSVTGLLKYSASEARIETLLQKARHAGHRLVLLYVDLDRFYSINDSMGFAAGDAALKMIAARLCALAGSMDVFRTSADEFLVVLSDIAHEANLLQLASQYCDCIAEPLIISPIVTLHLTASIGVSAFPEFGQTVTELTRQAEIAANRAKRGGRNAAIVFTDQLRAALDDRLLLGVRLRAALAQGEFLLHYQPQVNAQDGTISGLEALVRWDSPEFGLLPPGRFIPVAEDNGMILQLGAWVLRSACQQLRAWTDQGFSGFVVSVNVSAAQIQRVSFVQEVRSTLLETGIVPGMLELELTESGLMDNAERTVAQMRELKSLGVRLAMDDFGMGYSSLSYLQRFPLDKLKIDQAFVANIVQDGNDAVLVRAIIAMGQQLGMRVVAEGVETAAQYGYLRSNHCDELQGYFIARPVPPSEIAALLKKRFLVAGKGSESAERTLLLLDDEDNIRRSLIRLLRRDGYRILDASNARDAFELLATNHVQVILSDQRMPGMSGTEFLSEVKAMYPDTMRMVLSGFTDLSSITEAVNRGAIYKFLMKPWDDEALRAQVLEAFRHYERSQEATMNLGKK